MYEQQNPREEYKRSCNTRSRFDLHVWRQLLFIMRVTQIRPTLAKRTHRFQCRQVNVAMWEELNQFYDESQSSHYLYPGNCYFIHFKPNNNIVSLPQTLQNYKFVKQFTAMQTTWHFWFALIFFTVVEIFSCPIWAGPRRIPHSASVRF